MSGRSVPFVQKDQIQWSNLSTEAFVFYKTAAPAGRPHLLSLDSDASLLSQGEQHENHQNTSRTLPLHTATPQALRRWRSTFRFGKL